MKRPAVKRYGRHNHAVAAVRAVLARAVTLEAAGLPAADAIEVAGKEATGYATSVASVSAAMGLLRHGSLSAALADLDQQESRE